MMNSKEKLAAVESRVKEYETLETTTKADIENLETQLVEGKNSGSDLLKKQTFLQGVRETLSSLLSQKRDLEGQLANERASFDANQRLQRMADLARTAESLIAGYGELLVRSSAQVEEIGEKLAQHRIAINQARREFHELSKESNVTPIATGLGCTPEQFLAVSESKVRMPTVPLALVLGELESRAIAKTQKDLNRPRAA